MDDIPDGWVRVADYDKRAEDDHKSGPKGDYARILWQVRKHPGKAIRAYQSGSQWIACKADIDAFLRSFHETKQTKRSSAATDVDAVGISSRHAAIACETLASIATSLDDIRRTLDRMALAMDYTAMQTTQPKTAQQDLLSTMSSNGFHN